MVELEDLLKKALKKADEVEIYKQSRERLSSKSTLDKIESLSSKIFSGFSVRVIKNGRLGFSYFSDEKDFDNALKNAIYSSKFSKRLRMNLPKKQRYTKVKGLYDKKIKNLTEIEPRDILIDMLDESKKHKAHSVQNFITLTTDEVEMINSSKASYNKKETFMNIFASSQFKESQSYVSKASRKLIDGIEPARKSLILAEKFAGAKPTKGEYDIILHPVVVTSLFSQVFEPSIDGEEVFRKQSYFTDKLGKRIVNEDITIYDDPTIPAGLDSDFCDDEGIKTKNRKIVDKGILKNFLYDTEAAHLAKKKSTGSGFRNGFSSSVNISTSNIKMESRDIEKLAEIDGIFIYDVLAIHNITPVNGDFALEISNGCFFKNNEIGKPIRKCSLVGNYFDLLQNLRLLDDYQNFYYYYGPSWVYHGKIV